MPDRSRWQRMWHNLHDRYEVATEKLHARLPDQNSLKESRIHKLFGATLFSHSLWSFSPKYIARGLALGMFIAFTPTIGIQMLLVCACAVFLYQGNIPIGLAVCWITNPATAAPIYYAEYLVGEKILTFFGLPIQNMMEKGINISNMADVAGTLWFGSIISSFFLAVTSYYMVHLFVLFERRIRKDKIIHFRKKRKF